MYYRKDHTTERLLLWGSRHPPNMPETTGGAAVLLENTGGTEVMPLDKQPELLNKISKGIHLS